MIFIRRQVKPGNDYISWEQNNVLDIYLPKRLFSDVKKKKPKRKHIIHILMFFPF